MFNTRTNFLFVSIFINCLCINNLLGNPISNDVDISTNINSNNGDLSIVITSNLSTKMELTYVIDPYTFFGVLKLKPNNSSEITIKHIAPPSSTERYKKYVKEEVEQIESQKIFCVLNKNEKNIQTIKLWELPIWNDLEKGSENDFVEEIIIVLIQKLKIDEKQIRITKRIKLDKNICKELSKIQSQFPAKQKIIKWYYYSRIKNMVKYYDVLGQLAKACIEDSSDSTEIRRYKDKILECEKKLVLYQKFKEWDKKTLEEQKLVDMRPWRNAKGVPMDFFAKLIAFENDIVTLKEENGQTIQLKLNEFSEDNIDFLKEYFKK